jgi:hypothetical protein
MTDRDREEILPTGILGEGDLVRVEIAQWRCTKPFVAIAAKPVKFPFVQTVPNPYIVMTVSRNSGMLLNPEDLKTALQEDLSMTVDQASTGEMIHVHKEVIRWLK